MKERNFVHINKSMQIDKTLGKQFINAYELLKNDKKDLFKTTLILLHPSDKVFRIFKNITECTEMALWSFISEVE